MFNSYHYQLMSCKMTIGNETFDIKADRFISLWLEHDYMTLTVPYISLALNMSFILIDKIFNNKNKVKIMLDIMEIEKGDDNKIVAKKSVIKKSFEADMLRDRGTIIKDKHASTSNSTTDKFEAEYPVEFILYTSGDINLFKIEDNYLFENTAPGTALTKMLTGRGVTKNVIASIPKITKAVPNMSIPVGDLMTNIGHLFLYYGLYTDFPLVYKDIETFYIIDSNSVPVKTSATDKGVVKFILNDQKNFITGVVDMTTDKFAYIVSIKDNTIAEPTVNQDHVRMAEGANVISISPQGNIKKVNAFKNIAKTKVIREYHPLSVTNSLNSKTLYKSYNVSIDDGPASLFKPSLKYVFDSSITKDECSLYKMSIKLVSKALENGSTTIRSNISLQLQPIEKN